MTRCPYEDDVVLSFADGEPRDDSAALAAHLAECDCCRRAVDASRKLDTLLASRTDTTLSEADADRLLAFLGQASPAPRRRRQPWLVIAGLAAGLLLALGVVVVKRAGRTKAVPDRVAPDRVAIGKPAETVPSALRIPDGTSVPRLELTQAALDDATLARAFVNGTSIAPERLLDEARRLIRAAAPLGTLAAADRPLLRPDIAVKRPVGPLAGADADRLPAVAALWILREVRDGRLASGEAWLAAQALFAAEGDLRRDLVRRFRTATDVYAAWLQWQRYGGSLPATRRGEACALAGALGLPVRERVLAVLAWRDLTALAEQARRTGDEPSLTLLVDAWCAVARQSAARGVEALAWFEALAPRELSLLLGLLEARARASPRLPDRELAAQLRDALLAAHAADD